MVRNIHALVLKRLLMVWVLLSLVIGGLVVYLGLEKIDEWVLETAIAEARVFEQPLIDRMPQVDSELVSHLQRRAERLIRQHFVMVDVYDPQRRHVAIAVRPENARVQQVLEARHHRFPLDRVQHYEKFYIDGELYLQVLTPLYTNAGELAGYFEGVYRVSRQALEEIEHGVYRTLLLVIVVVFTTSAILYPVIIALNRELIRFARDVFKANVELMEVMGTAISKRDSNTDSHNYRVTLYALRFAETLGLPHGQLRDLIAGAFLHDVGKIGVRDQILQKPGKLSEEEFRLMREHVVIGIDIIAKAEWLRGARDVVEFHHEWFDGSGYARGLKGDEIPLNARIFAIVDVFDALTMQRPYKEALGLDQTLEMLREGRGTHFDPVLLDRFCEVAPHLYKTIGRASYVSLTRWLAVAVRRYFFE